MGKLIIHIGPPKTATTALQLYWMGLHVNNFKYCGIIQPRKTDSLATDLFIYSDINIVSSLKQLCKNEFLNKKQYQGLHLHNLYSLE